MTDLSMLNPQQKDAIEQSINKNVVLLAAAGSGKTTVLVKRTQYLIDDLNVDPESIMLITFTNKAANEIRERVAKISNSAYKMWIGTFHKICTRLIRMFGNRIGIENFTILDQKDAKTLIKDIMTSNGSEPSAYMVNDMQSKISSLKNNLKNPASLLNDASENKMLAGVYQEYQNICWKKKSFDFDDLIIYAILLLSSYPDVLAWVNGQFKYVMVDETQDTNSAQFSLIKLLCGQNNVMCVGDVNQSIYAFRNAKPQYLEYFADTHPNTIKLKLEQNYRSTKNIINAANAMIAKNEFGTKIEMFCSNEDGTPVMTHTCNDIFDEARWIATEIICSGQNFSDFAIIYRTNTQSRAIEDALTALGVPYTVFGSQSFYARKEVRDLLAYCKFVINDKDTNAFERILGTVQGVGKVTIEKITGLLSETCTTHDVIDVFINQYKPSNTIIARLQPISAIGKKMYNKCSEIIEDVLSCTDYQTALQSIQTEETEEKLAIISDFQDSIKAVEENNPNDSMSAIVDQIALLSDAKGEEKANLNAVKLMTAHASKGLEFNTVFIVGAEEGLFPHMNAINSNNTEAIEEERRLFYVAMTRAKKNLFITKCALRKTSKEGVPEKVRPSRFLREIPNNLIQNAF